MKLVEIFASALLLFTSVVQSATLILPTTVKALVVNGVESSDNPIENLVIGQNQIVVEYSQILKDGSNKELMTSKPLVFDIAVTKDDDTINLKHERLTSYKVAENAFRKNEVEWTVTSDSKSTSLRPVILPGNRGFLPYSDIEKAVATYNSTNGIVVSRSGSTNLTDAVITVDATGKAQVTGDSVSQLKLWYAKASKQERKEFRKWMIDQD